MTVTTIIKIMKKNLFIFLLTLSLLLIPTKVEAQTTQAVYFYLPASANIGTNSDLVVDLRVDSTDEITSVKASLEFDPARLSVVSVDGSSGPFGTIWEQVFDNTAGTISVQRSTPAPGVLGDNLVVKITFKAKVTLGDTTVGYDTGCFAASNPTCLALTPSGNSSTNILASGTESVLTVITPTPTPTSAPYGTPSYGTPSYGSPSYGSPSYGTPSYGTPSSSGGKIGDLNSDGKVNIFDLSIMLRNWNKSGTGDLNSDGKVNIFDLSILLRNWG